MTYVHIFPFDSMLYSRLTIPSPTRNPSPLSTTPFCSSSPSLPTTSLLDVSWARRNSSTSPSSTPLTSPKTKPPSRTPRRPTLTARQGSEKLCPREQGSHLHSCTSNTTLHMVGFQKRVGIYACMHDGSIDKKGGRVYRHLEFGKVACTTRVID